MMNSIQPIDNTFNEAFSTDDELIDLRRLQMFCIAMSEGTFSAAANVMNVSPSAVSHALKSLEEEVGCSLFKRSGPHVKPTAAALRILPTVVSLMQNMKRVRSELARLGGRDDKLVFAITQSSLPILAPSVMSSFCECFPNSQVEVVSMEIDTTSSYQSELDFQIIHDEHVPRYAIKRMITEQHLGLYAAPFHPLGQGIKVTISQLRQYVTVFPDAFAADLANNEWMNNQSSWPKRWILPGAQAAREMATQGQCIAFLPSSIAESALRNGELSQINISAPPLKRSFSAWWHSGKPLAWSADVFLSLLVAHHSR